MSILNYTVTSNHIHFLVADEKGRDVIPDSIKLIAGRTGQEFNQRKARKGAYWEDRYHATAVENGNNVRDDKRTCSVAVGSRWFTQDMRELMGGLVSGRELSESEKSFQLREAQTPYSALFKAEMGEIDLQKQLFLELK